MRKEFKGMLAMISSNSRFPYSTKRKVFVGNMHDHVIDSSSTKTIGFDYFLLKFIPILSYTSETELENIILNYEKPLSLYVFSKRNKFQEKVIKTYG
ncbi:MAG: hypothetical protein AAFY00_02205, partial [Bacteroidota bacterium]